MSLAARELNTLAAARNSGALTAEAYRPFYESLVRLAQRAQHAGATTGGTLPVNRRQRKISDGGLSFGTTREGRSRILVWTARVSMRISSIRSKGTIWVSSPR